MLVVGSALVGYHIETNDGAIGKVSDFLFDDNRWRIRWLVVDTGDWLSERLVLIHPSAILKVDHERKVVPVGLSRNQVSDSPSIAADLPVSRQAEVMLYDYYGWDPLWGTGLYGMDMMGGYIGPPRYFGVADIGRATDMAERMEDNDPHLQSLIAVKSYHVQATDGQIGHVENILIDDTNWDLRYLIIDTSNWWMGQRVLMSPYAITDVNWASREFQLNVSKERVQASPKWDEETFITQLEEQGLHSHYGWAGYGW